MVAQKFDELAAVEPWPFVGAVARSDRELLTITIDAMVTEPNNVPSPEAAKVWGLPSKSYDALKSHSATDVSECAFKHYGGDMHRFKSVVGDVVWNQWEAAAEASADEIATSVRRLEASYAAREIRRVDLTHALFHLGRRSDTEGSVRVAMVYKGTLGVTKAAKHYVETGLSLEGVAITAEAAAVAAATKQDANKRKRQAPAVQKSDQCNVRRTMLAAQLKLAGLELDDGVEERAFIERGPASVAKIMAMISDMIQKRVVQTVQTAQASPCSSSRGS